MILFLQGILHLLFLFATVFALRCKDIKAVPVLCYSAAIIVGISRLIEHEHWASDVFAGAIQDIMTFKKEITELIEDEIITSFFMRKAH